MPDTLEYYFWILATILFVATGEGLLFVVTFGYKKPQAGALMFGPGARKIPAMMLRLVSYSIGAAFWIVMGYFISGLLGRNK